MDFIVQLWDLFSTRSLRRVRREVVSPHDALRLMKQPRGDTRSAVRSADYMAQTLRLLNERMHHVHKRSLNATGQTCIVFVAALPGWHGGAIKCIFHFFFFSDLLSEEDLNKLAEITGCAARARLPECSTTPNLNTHRTITSVCNNL